MSNYRVARRYATALLQSAEDENQLEETARDVELIGKTVRESRDLRLVLASPVIPKEKKKRILSDLFGKKTNPITLRFLDLLTEKDREGNLMDIIDEFMRLLDEKGCIVRVDVASAVALTEAQVNRLKEQLELYTGKKIVLNFRLDPSILGGFIIRLDDRIIDGSLSHQLELLREKFLEGAHVAKG